MHLLACSGMPGTFFFMHRAAGGGRRSSVRGEGQCACVWFRSANPCCAPALCVATVLPIAGMPARPQASAFTDLDPLEFARVGSTSGRASRPHASGSPLKYYPLRLYRRHTTPGPSLKHRAASTFYPVRLTLMRPPAARRAAAVAGPGWAEAEARLARLGAERGGGGRGA